STRRKHTLPQLIPWQGHDRLARNSSPPLTATYYWWSGLHWTAKVDHSQSATNTKSAFGRPAIGDSPPVLSFHLPGENSRIGPPFVFPHQDWLLVHFLHIFAAKNLSTWAII